MSAVRRPPRPTITERLVSPVVTTGLALLGLPNRKALARSLKEQAKYWQMTPSEQRWTIELLIECRILQPSAEQTGLLTELRPGQFTKLDDWGKIEAFCERFNKQFKAERLEIAISRRQFSLKRKPQKQIDAGPEVTKPEITAVRIIPRWEQIKEVLDDAALPLTKGEIQKELARKGDRLMIEEIAEILGQAQTPKTVLATWAEESADRRYFLASKEEQMRKTHVTPFRRSEGETVLLFNRDAKRLRDRDEAFRVIKAGGQIEFVSAQYLADHPLDYFPVLAKFKNHLAPVTDQSTLLEEGLLEVGLEPSTNEVCDILRAAREKYTREIFHNFVRRIAGGADADKLRRLEAACRANRFNVSRLAAAETVARLGGGINALVLALCPEEADLKKLESSGVFSAEEIARLKDGQRRANYVCRHPLLVNFGFSYGLQNLFHTWIAKMAHFEVMLVVLARKYVELRQIADSGEPLPLEFALQIEVLYAPLAEKYAFIDLANDLRDLVFRINDPAEYARTWARQMADVGLPRDQAERHLRLVTDAIEEDLSSAGGKITATSYRLKTLYAASGKGDHLDDCGIRLRCKTLGEADRVAALLEAKFLRPSHYCVDIGKPEILDRLHKEQGWRGYRIYITDPTQPEGTEKRRILAVQVMTDRMQKEDKQGGAGHWFFKAARAAQEMYFDLKWAKKDSDFNPQIMDDPPIDRYNGDPEHDFNIDVEIARQKQTVYFQGDNRIVFDEPSPALRLAPGETVADLLSFRSQGEVLLKPIVVTELYVLKLDDVEKPTMRPLKKGNAKVPLETVIPTVEGPETIVVVIKQGAEIPPVQFQAKLRLAMETAKSPRAIFLLRRHFCSLPYEALVEAGREKISALGHLSQRQTEEIRNYAELAPGELLPALALGIIPDETIEQVIGSIRPEVHSTPIDNELRVSIETPDRPGLLAAALTYLKQGAVTRLISRTLPRARRTSMVVVDITIRPESPESMMIDSIGLKRALENVAAEFTTRPDTTYLHRLELTLLPSNGDWNVIKAVLPKIAVLGLNVASLDLPARADEEKPVGRLVIEAYSNEPRPDTEIELLSEDLAGAFPDLVFELSQIS